VEGIGNGYGCRSRQALRRRKSEIKRTCPSFLGKKNGEAHSDGRFLTKTPTSTVSFTSFFSICSIDLETVYAREQKDLDPAFNLKETGGPGTLLSLPLNNSSYFEKRLRKALVAR